MHPRTPTGRWLSFNKPGSMLRLADRGLRGLACSVCFERKPNPRAPSTIRSYSTHDHGNYVSVAVSPTAVKVAEPKLPPKRRQPKHLRDIPGPLLGQKTLDVLVEEDDMHDLFEALSAPAKSVSAVGPSAASALKLDPDYLYRLKLKFENRTSERGQRIEGLVERTDRKLAQRRQKLSLVDITEVIHVNALMKRPDEAQKAFNLIAQNGMQPDMVAYNQLMNAYRLANDSEKMMEIFNSIKESGLSPDEVSYGILVHAAVKSKDLRTAFCLYEEMKRIGLKPTQPIYTTLIKGCVDSNDIQRAWRTFNYMRSEIAAPDEVTYSLMIHACAKTKDAEKALDLFQEMAERHLSPTEVTFTSLVEALGSRKDYYLEAFDILSQMAGEGFSPSLKTYNVLLRNAARVGDVVRARLVWNDMAQRGIHPDSATFKTMFDCWGAGISIGRKQKAEAASTPGDAGAISQDVRAGVDSAEALTSGIPDDACDRSSVTRSEGSVPTLHSGDNRPHALLQEMRTLFQYFESVVGTNADLKVERSLIQAYLSAICACRSSTATFPLALDVVDTVYPKYGITVDGHARSELLAVLTKQPALMREKGEEYWKKFLEWDAAREEEIGKEVDGRGQRTELEKEEIRAQEGRGRRLMLRNFHRMINGFTRIGNIDAALGVLRETQSFRYPSYLANTTFRDIPALLDKCRDLADDGKLGPAKELLELCPRPAKDPLLEVQRRLRTKLVPNNWWGWEALGVEKVERHRKAVLKQKRRR
ncbi:hypothetical protein HDU85_004527 [Gaertneriomyces sp. JEL0708]|nr:hypothetical protein HDU85_004527 [Gaertneriomyces sp. JEL0708]